ncbi:nitrite reductase small subunit NirD [Streptomyces piniterrae]|uniref:Nitrite reductase small subunit NirD n=1 Tax=Streptomyces piniterrae TaxID=2571125 RepID=A0A4U0NMU9_9ACTN|nr:nitrite reductase small subunit NirD [Streptomyces piniterrae]TJZ55715.1 nitrite reductase small subunit NirD [Streptomyces piniterrae]
MTTALTPDAAVGSRTPGADAQDATATVEIFGPQGWFAVCAREDLIPGRGVAALLPDGEQVALFVDRAGRAYAIANRDPFTGAYVLSRGLTGSSANRPFVASPLLKQRFDLATGECLDDPSVSVRAYQVRVRGEEG